MAEDGTPLLDSDQPAAPDQQIYELFKLPGSDEASVGRLLSVIKSFGIPDTDPRLKTMLELLEKFEREAEVEGCGESVERRHFTLNKDKFKLLVSANVSLVMQCLRARFVIPKWVDFCQSLRQIYSDCAGIDAGTVRSNSPNPDAWGVSICSIDGQRISFGDANSAFCMQSLAKTFNYVLAASAIGEKVHDYVGQEPSGREFSGIYLDASTNRPHNPLINSGAIIVSALVEPSRPMDERFKWVLAKYRAIAGGRYVGFDNAAFLAERATADRNYALSHFLKEYGCFPRETESISAALDFYFQLCSFEATCESAAVMAATLANGGVCPLTQEKCFERRACRDALSLMFSCGMYDFSGQFAFIVGLPAKSARSGAILLVVPNVMGVALWSPRLDSYNNSVRGVEFCKRLIAHFNFHNYDSLEQSQKVHDRVQDQVYALLYAAREGDLNTLRRLYMLGCSMDMADYDKRTALHLAACEGHYELCKFLINVAKVPFDPKDRWGQTPLDEAVRFYQSKCAKFLQKATQRLRHSQHHQHGRHVKGASSHSSLTRSVRRSSVSSNSSSSSSGDDSSSSSSTSSSSDEKTRNTNNNNHYQHAKQRRRRSSEDEDEEEEEEED